MEDEPPSVSNSRLSNRAYSCINDGEMYRMIDSYNRALQMGSALGVPNMWTNPLGIAPPVSTFPFLTPNTFPMSNFNPLNPYNPYASSRTWPKATFVEKPNGDSPWEQDFNTYIPEHLSHQNSDTWQSSLTASQKHNLERLRRIHEAEVQVKAARDKMLSKLLFDTEEKSITASADADAVIMETICFLNDQMQRLRGNPGGYEFLNRIGEFAEKNRPSFHHGQDPDTETSDIYVLRQQSPIDDIKAEQSFRNEQPKMDQAADRNSGATENNGEAQSGEARLGDGQDNLETSQQPPEIPNGDTSENPRENPNLKNNRIRYENQNTRSPDPEDESSLDKSRRKSESAANGNGRGIPKTTSRRKQRRLQDLEASSDKPSKRLRRRAAAFRNFAVPESDDETSSFSDTGDLSSSSGSGSSSHIKKRRALYQNPDSAIAMPVIPKPAVPVMPAPPASFFSGPTAPQK